LPVSSSTSTSATCAANTKKPFPIEASPWADVWRVSIGVGGNSHRELAMIGPPLK
jgi:hypothetical protein